MKVLMEIWNNYAQGYLVIDCLGAMILLLNLIVRWEGALYFKIVLLLKIPQCVKKM